MVTIAVLWSSYIANPANMNLSPLCSKNRMFLDLLSKVLTHLLVQNICHVIV